uniref:G-protein coupled receptors family 1 profile domain-containing protein n=1 Tax=Amphimedon queenslandica TaxID=400682 RepID=A0A1X7UGK3_AMPQE
MDNDSNTSNCVDGNSEEIDIIEGVFGGLGVIACTVALVFVIVSRFYKDIVQRLILYQLIAMLVFSLSQFLFPYDAILVLISHITYHFNLILTFWLTIILYLCIVCLKKLKAFKKFETIAILSSFLSFLWVAIIPFVNYNDCTKTWEIKFSEQETNEIYYFLAASYSITISMYIAVSVLVTIIFIITVRRSRLHLQRQNEDQGHSLLVTNNKWKILSKQLLPLVVYPIVNTVMILIFFPLLTLHYTGDTSVVASLYSFVSSYGFITGVIVITHLCILKYRRREKKQDRLLLETIVLDAEDNNGNNQFTSETIASTNARTEYNYTRTSSYHISQQ